ncbi:MAG: hypothetical protein LCH67_20290 [Bacteroidetes bacterium]|nr:hypothetical protein [Bacteroidota bacterium]
MRDLLNELQVKIQEKLKNRKIDVKVVTQGNKRNQALTEIKITGFTKNGDKADSIIVFYCDTMVAKYAEGNTDVCEWILKNFVKRPNYDVYNKMIPAFRRYP